MKSLITFFAAFCMVSSTSSARAATEYGMFEKSSDGKFSSVCPVREDGAIICQYTLGFQKASATIDKIDLVVHQQIMRSLSLLGAAPFAAYDEAVRKLLPEKNFLMNGFYIKFDSSTILIDFAHFYTPLQVSVPTGVSNAVNSIMQVLSQVYYLHLSRVNPLVKKQNRCPVLTGEYVCPKNNLQITQMNFGIDDLYAFSYSDRKGAFDFAANDAGMKNAVDKFTASCTEQGLVLDGSLMRLNANGDLEIGTTAGPVVCRRQATWR